MTFAKAVLLLAASIFSSLPVGASEGLDNSPLAGWAEVDITPPLGIALGGRAGPVTKANKVMDPLYAQLLLLKDAKGAGFILVSFDVIGLPHDLSDRIRADLVHETGVSWDLIVLNASHTHSGPYTLRSLMAGVGPAPKIEVDYFDSLEEKIISAVREASKTLKPARVEVFEGKSDVGINRRGKNEQGERSIRPDPTGPYDDKLWVLRVTPVNSDSAPAVIFSYACHPVLVYGHNFAAISADFPGAARRALRESLGTNAHVQFVQGFAGNIRPRVVADLEKNKFRTSTPQDVQRAGTDLANAALAAMKGKGTELTLDLVGAEDRPFLPRDKPPPRQNYEKMRTQAMATTNNYLIAVSDYWLEHYDTGEGFARGDEWSLGLIRLSEKQWIVHSGGEPCIEWRGKMAHWLEPLNIVTWGYSQEAKSYLPTESLLPEGGYEVLESNRARLSTPAPYAPGIEAAIRDSLLQQLAFIRANRNQEHASQP
jgi:hypothetical protein